MRLIGKIQQRTLENELGTEQILIRAQNLAHTCSNEGRCAAWPRTRFFRTGAWVVWGASHTGIGLARLRCLVPACQPKRRPPRHERLVANLGGPAKWTTTNGRVRR